MLDSIPHRGLFVAGLIYSMSDNALHIVRSAACITRLRMSLLLQRCICCFRHCTNAKPCDAALHLLLQALHQ